MPGYGTTMPFGHKTYTGVLRALLVVPCCCVVCLAGVGDVVVGLNEKAASLSPVQATAVVTLSSLLELSIL